MYYTYILKSLKDQTYYYGHTQDIDRRIRTHNSGKVRYTKGHRPYELHYVETFNSKEDAAKRERFFKSIEGYNLLKSKGIT